MLVVLTSKFCWTPSTFPSRVNAVEQRKPQWAFEPIQSLVARAIDRFPDRVAVQTAHGSLRYRELDQRVDAVAAELYRCGARGASVVAVLAGDRAELTAALLAVLRLAVWWSPSTWAPGRIGWAGCCARRTPISWSSAPTTAPSRRTCATRATGPPWSISARSRTDPGTTTRPTCRRRNDPCYLFFTSAPPAGPRASSAG